MQIWKGMTDSMGNAVALKSLAWEGVAQDLVLTLKCKQTYKNETKDNIEAVYTFPVGWQATVSRFAVEMNGKTLVAQAMAKKDAEEKYEDAIESGDTPVMLEYSHDGLCTANLGNIKPDETVVVEIETVSTLTWNNGNVRIVVPTVIGDRYSSDGSQGRLRRHQQVSSNFMVEYPVDFHLELKGLLAYGEVDVPQHTARIEKTMAGITVDLKRAFANKDIIVAVENLQAVNGSVFAEDPIAEGQWAGFHTFTPIHKALSVKPAYMKILVDCSGSMSGSSIQLAKHALKSLADNLKEDDVITLSRFGSGTEHSIKDPSNCTRKFMRQSYQPLVEEISANMGGTDMDDALESVIKLGKGIFKKYTADILMITDGEVWDSDTMIDIVRKGQHRLFVIGVGVAPGENLLRRLADETGGVCEMVSPTEDMDEVVSRMLSRMRLAQLSDISVEWDVKPVWHSPIPKNAYLGESITISAIFNQAPMTPVSLRCKSGNDVIDVQADSRFVKDEGQIAKAVVNGQCKLLDDYEERTNLAVKYSLISENTNLILVHERAEGEKAEGMPVLKQIPQMAVEECVCMDRMVLSEPRAYRRMAGNVCFDMEVHARPAPQAMARRAAKPLAQMDNVSMRMSRRVAEALADVCEYSAPCQAPSLVSPLDDVIRTINLIDLDDQEALRDFIRHLPTEITDALHQSGFELQTNLEIAIAALASWLISERIGRISRTVRTFVRQTLANIDAKKVNEAKTALTEARILNGW